MSVDGQGKDIRETMISPMKKLVREDIKEFKVRNQVVKNLIYRIKNANSVVFKNDMKTWSRGMHLNQSHENLLKFVKYPSFLSVVINLFRKHIISTPPG